MPDYDFEDFSEEIDQDPNGWWDDPPERDGDREMEEQRERRWQEANDRRETK